eukprot:579229-Amphidinium_carterae.1
MPKGSLRGMLDYMTVDSTLGLRGAGKRLGRCSKGPHISLAQIPYDVRAPRPASRDQSRR